MCFLGIKSNLGFLIKSSVIDWATCVIILLHFETIRLEEEVEYD